MNQSVKVSVITVCLNVAEQIRETLESIAQQTYSNIEYIVIDGASTDGTLKIIDEYKSTISHFSSEPDEGLYYAMNKGLKSASGDFVCFMNAGDLFFSHDTVANAVPLLEDADLLYGDTQLIDESGNPIGLRSEVSTHTLPKRLQLSSLYLGQPFSHQSLFVRRELCPLYDTRYRIGADYDWFINIIRKNPKSVQSPQPISRFRKGGLSSSFWRRSLQERIIIQRRQFGLGRTVLSHVKIVLRGIGQILAGKKLK